MIEYRSNTQFNSQIVSELVDPSILKKLTYELYSNDDYEKYNLRGKSEMKDGETSSSPLEPVEETECKISETE